MQKHKQYPWNAADYAVHSSAQQAWARELIAKLGLEGHETVLDLGCGDGKVTAEIACQLADGTVLGVDSSTDMIELARKECMQKQHPNLSFKLGDARRLGFKEEFDVVFSNAALHWVKDHEPVLSGLYKSLRQNGRVLLQMGGKGNAAAMLTTLQTLMARKDWAQYFSDFAFPYGFYEPEQYREWLGHAGFKPIRVELIPKDMVYKEIEGLAGWIRTTWLPYTSRIPTNLRNEFISQLIEEYIEGYPLDSGGRVHLAMVRLEVEAVKA